MFFEFIKNHYELIISCLMLLISILINIFKKRPTLDVMRYVLMYLPDAVNEAEKTDLKGQDKLYYALRYVIDIVEKVFNIKVSRYLFPQILLEIEKILTTPTKK